MLKSSIRSLSVIAALALAACGDSTGPGQEQELITRVSLTLTPVGGSVGQTVYIDDPDGLGPLPPSGQNIGLSLTGGMSYTGVVRFENQLVTPPENITEEVAAEADEHGVIYTSMDGAAFTVTDTDSMGKFLGLTFNVNVENFSGGGVVRVVLCHYDGVTKPATATACTGDTDADVSFIYTIFENTARAGR